MLLSLATSEYSLLLGSVFYFFLLSSTIPYFIRFPSFLSVSLSSYNFHLNISFLFYFLRLFYLLLRWSSQYCDGLREGQPKKCGSFPSKIK